MVGLTLVMLYQLQHGGIQVGLLGTYMLLPVALTSAFIVRSAVIRRVVEGVEAAADDQAVAWGASTVTLAGALEQRIRAAEFGTPAVQ